MTTTGRGLSPYIISLIIFGCGPEAPVDEPLEVIDERTIDASEPPGTFAQTERMAPESVSRPTSDEIVADLALRDGSVVQFFVAHDGSAGVLEEARTAPVINDAMAEAGSIAEIFWALTEGGTDIPAPLMRHHALMVADGEAAAAFVGEQGWLLERVRENMAIARATSSSPCLNATFAANHCSSSNYPSGPCQYNAQSEAGWTTGYTRRFKAGFCLQSGTADARLSYSEVSRSGSICLSNRVYRYIWDTQFQGGPFAATTYLSWTWIGPSGGKKRVWHHRIQPTPSGAVFDWASRFSYSNNCGPI